MGFAGNLLKAVIFLGLPIVGLVKLAEDFTVPASKPVSSISSASKLLGSGTKLDKKQLRSFTRNGRMTLEELKLVGPALIEDFPVLLEEIASDNANNLMTIAEFGVDLTIKISPLVQEQIESIPYTESYSFDDFAGLSSLPASATC